MRKQFLALVAFACIAALSGCDCGGKKRDVCTDPQASLAFLSPTGNTLTEFNDADDNPANGIQYTVRIQTIGLPEGTQITLVDGLSMSIPETVVIDDADSLTGHVDFGEITFREGQTHLCATGTGVYTELADGSTRCKPQPMVALEECKDVTVALDVPACRFDSPTDGQTLTAADDASAADGFQADVALVCKGVNDGETLTLQVGDRPALEGTLANSAISFDDVDLAEGANLLSAETTGQDGSTVQAQIGVTVDTGGCAVRLMPADGTTLSGDDDEDPDTAGLQVTLTVQTDAVGAFACADGATVTVMLDGSPVDAGTFSGGQATVQATLPDGNVEAYAEVSGSSTGRSLTNTWFVCATPIDVALSAPSDGLTITDAADRDADEPGIQVAVTGTTAGVGTAESCQLLVDGAVFPSAANPLVPSVFFPGSDYAFEYVTFAESRSYALQVRCQDACGAEAASLVNTVTVQTQQLTCTIEDPIDSQVLNTADDKDGDPANDLQYDVVMTTQNAPDGTVIQLDIGGQAPVAGQVTGGSWTPEVAFEDGADKQLRCVLNGQPAGSPISITVDNTAPTVEFLAPADGAQYQVTDAQVDLLFTGVEDGQLATIQVDGQPYTVTVTGNSASTTVTLNGQSGSTVTNTLVATVSDAAGNAALPAQIQVDVTLVDDPPILTFIDPDESQAQPITVDEASRIYTVIVQAENVVTGTPVELVVVDNGHDRAPLIANTSGAGFATFASVMLPRHDVELRATASNVVGQGTKSVQLQVGDVSLPQVSITAPADGTFTQTALQSVTVDSDVESGQTCWVCTRARPGSPSLPVDCDAGLAVASGQADANGDLAVDVTFTEGDRQVWASCENAAGDVGTSVPNRLVLDTTPPQVDFVEPVDADVYNAASVDRAPGTAGFQIRVRLSADVADGTTVSYLQVDGVNATIIDDPLPVFAGNLITFNAVTVVDQTSPILTAEVCDQAGNCATATPVQITVDRLAPNIIINDPQNQAQLGAADDESAAQGFQYDVEVTMVDAALGDEVVLERNVDDGGWQEAARHTLAAGETATYTFDNATLEPTGLDAANVRIRATITDAAGNDDTDEVGIDFNVLAPEVAITRPDDGDTFNLGGDFCPEAGFQTQVDVSTTNTQAGDLLVLCVCNGACPAPDPGSADRCAQAGHGAEVWVGTVTGVTTPVPCTPMAEGVNVLSAFSENIPGQGNFSNPVTVTVDSIPPTVDSLTVTSDADASGCLNQAEGNLQLTVNISDQGSGVEGRIARLLRDWPPGTQLATATVSGGVANFSVALADGDYALTVVVTDALGNPNIDDNPVIPDPEAQFAISVDSAPPTLAISYPDHTPLNASDDDDPGTPNVLDFTFSAATNAEDGQQVSFGPMAQNGTVSGGAASIQATLGQGPATLTADVSDACGNPAPTASYAVTVDTVPPTITCSQPADNDIFNVQNVQFDCTTTGAEAGQSIRVVSTIGGQRCTFAIDGTGNANFPCNLQPGVQDLTVTVTDAAGNVSSPDTISSVNVDITGCPIALTSYSGNEIFNAADDKDGNAGNGLQIDVEACSGSCDANNCPSCSVVLTLNGAQFGQALSLDGSGCVTFTDVQFSDGESGTDVQVEIDDGAGNLTNDSFTVELVDLIPPTLERLAPGADSVQCVAATGNPNANGSDILADKIAGGDCQMDFSFRVTDGGDAVYNGSLVVDEGGSPVAGPSSVSSSPQTINYTNATLTHDAIHALVVTATDGAGNTATLNMSVEADVIAPAEVADATAVLAHSRHADVDMSWTAVGDDGPSGSPAAYIVRWDTANIVDEPGWDAAAEVYSGVSTSPTVQWLPPLNTYHFAVRAADEVGNLGPIPTADVVLGNLWSSVDHTGSGVGFGYRLINAGDLNNDGRDDLVAANHLYSSNQGIVHVLYGDADLSTWSAADADQELADGTVGGQLGFDVAGMGDLDGDNIGDLVIGSPGFESERGRVFVFFGRDGASLPASPDVVLRADPATSTRFGRVVNILGDINDDGFDDLFIGAPRADSNGRGYVYFGRPRAGADSWTDNANFVTGNDGDGVNYVPVANADLNFLGVDVDDAFSYHNGTTALGDVDGDGFDDFAIVASTVNEVYTFDGASTSQITGRDISPDADSVDVISYNTPQGTDGFGVNSAGGEDFSGDGRPDLIVTDIYTDRAYLFETIDTGGGDPAYVIDTAFTTSVFQSGNFGFSVDAMDVTLDGWADLIVGTNAAGGNAAYLYFNTQVDPFLSDAPNATLTGTGFFGIGVALGDFDGDGLPDVAVSSPVDGDLTVVY